MQQLSYSSGDFIPMDSFVNTSGHFNNSLIKWGQQVQILRQHLLRGWFVTRHKSKGSLIFFLTFIMTYNT